MFQVVLGKILENKKKAGFSSHFDSEFSLVAIFKPFTGLFGCSSLISFSSGEFSTLCKNYDGKT
jgi:hypothetical protein